MVRAGDPGRAPHHRSKGLDETIAYHLLLAATVQGNVVTLACIMR